MTSSSSPTSTWRRVSASLPKATTSYHSVTGSRCLNRSLKAMLRLQYVVSLAERTSGLLPTLPTRSANLISQTSFCAGLDRRGVVNERVVVADGVWLRTDHE